MAFRGRGDNVGGEWWEKSIDKHRVSRRRKPARVRHIISRSASVASKQLRNGLFDPVPRSVPIKALQTPHRRLELRVPSILDSLAQSGSDGSCRRRGRRGLRVDDAVEEEGLLAQESGLVGAISLVEVEGDVEEGCGQSCAADLDWGLVVSWRVAGSEEQQKVSGGVGRGRGRTKPLRKPMSFIIYMMYSIGRVEEERVAIEGPRIQQTRSG